MGDDSVELNKGSDSMVGESPELCSKRMSRVGRTDTKPEMAVRRLLHNRGFRYRVNVAYLPGSPDIVFTARKKLIFVHGCFWHRHRCRKGRSTPATNVKIWIAKFERNRQRDARDRRQLRRLGWTILVVWECEISDTIRLEARLSRFLGRPRVLLLP